MWLLEICVTIAFLKKIHKGKRRLPPPSPAAESLKCLDVDCRRWFTRKAPADTPLCLSFFFSTQTAVVLSLKKKKLLPDSLLLCMN